LSRKRSRSSSIATTCSSNAGRPLRSRAAASPCSRAPCAPQAESAKTRGSRPSVSPARFSNVARDLVEIGRRPHQVGLVQHQHDLLAPLADRGQERALALRVGAVGRGDEEHEIGTRQEVARQRLVLAQDRVGAGGVDDRDLAQDRGGRADLADAVGPEPALDLRAVAQDRDARRRGRHALLQHR
jgi:hypothetical protein